MKISSITRLTGAILALIVASLIAAIFWSLDRLDSAFAMKDAYHDYKEHVYLDLEKPVSQYLMSGDATLLTKIDKNIEKLHTLTEQELPSKIQQEVQEKLSQIKNNTLPALRAAGKLAQPEVLLVQNERELNAALLSIKEYAEKADYSQQEQKQQFLDYVMEIQHLALNLAHSRQEFFRIGSDTSLDQLNHYLEDLSKNSESLYQLPRLGIYKESEEEDDLAELLGIASADSKETTREEIGEEPLSTARNLIARYPKELDNAKKFSAQKATTNTNATISIEVLESSVASVAETISEQYEQTHSTVYILMGICIVLITLTGISMNYLLNRLGTILIATTAYIDQLSHGKVSCNVDIDSQVTEVKVLHQSIERLQQFFRQLLGNIKTETNNLQDLQRSAISEAGNLESNVQQQQHATENAVVQITQLNGSFMEVATRASQTSSATQGAAKLASTGYNRIHETGECIAQLNDEISHTAVSLNELQQDSIAIQNVLGVIQGFAEQTNLLALNAAIEAARAGDTGRGFAVVADEVRNLAANTAKSADEIQGIISRLSQTTETTVAKMSTQQEAALRTVELANEAQSAIETIRHSIDEINDMSTLIASSTEEQTAVTSDIARTIEVTNEMTSHSKAAADNNKRQAEQLSHASEKLTSLISQLS